MNHDNCKKPKIYTPEMLIEKLRLYKKEFGKLPTKNDFSKNPKYPSPTTYINHFGLWSIALSKADESYSKFTYSDEELLDILINFEGTLTQKNFKKKNNPSINTYAKRFGSWSKALILAKKRELKIKSKSESEIRNKLNNSPIKYDENTLIQILHEYYEIEGEIPTQASLLMKKAIYPSPSTFAYRFGSWGKALEAANFKSIRQNYSDDELIEMLKNFDGKVTKKIIDSHTDYPHSTTYINRFGSWTNAMKKAGRTLNKNRLKND